MDYKKSRKAKRTVLIQCCALMNKKIESCMETLICQKINQADTLHHRFFKFVQTITT